MKLLRRLYLAFFAGTIVSMTITHAITQEIHAHGELPAHWKTIFEPGMFLMTIFMIVCIGYELSGQNK